MVESGVLGLGRGGPWEASGSRLQGRDGAQAWCPKGEEDVVACLSAAREQGAGLWPVGSGLHLSVAPAQEARLLDMRGMSHIAGWDPVSGTVTVEAGVRFGQLESWLESRGGSLSGWRRAHPEATLGGLLGRWQPVGHALWNGSAREACVALSAVTGAGQRYRYLIAPRKSSGPDLRHLFVGGQGVFGVMTAMTLGVSQAPQRRLKVSCEGVAPEVALETLAVAFAQGVRAPNVLYSGEARALVVWLEGGEGFVEAQRAALEVAGEAQGVAWRDESAQEGPGDAWGGVRLGGDPVSGREAAEGAVAIWGGLRALKTLPEACWAQGVLYEVSAHQAALWLPASSEALKGLGVDVAGGRALWWGQAGCVAPGGASVGVAKAAMVAMKVALDPEGVLPPLSSVSSSWMGVA